LVGPVPPPSIPEYLIPILRWSIFIFRIVRGATIFITNFL